MNALPLFSWSVNNTTRYSTALWLPELSDADAGRRPMVAEIPLLSGGVAVLRQGRAGRADTRMPGRFTLTWEIADPAFLRVAREDAAMGATVTVALDHRWRQLQVASSGQADRTVLIDAGWARINGDTGWLQPDTGEDTYALTVGDTHTIVYVTAAGGLLTAASGETLPEGAIQLAAMTVSNAEVSISTSPSGVSNAITAAIVEYTETPAGGGAAGQPLTRLEIVLREIN